MKRVSSVRLGATVAEGRMQVWNRIVTTIAFFSTLLLTACTEPNPFAILDGGTSGDGQARLDTGKPRGTEGGVCYPNNTCNPGLTCKNGICVKTGDGGPSLDGPADAAKPDAPQNPCNPPGYKPLLLKSDTPGDWSVALEDKSTHAAVSISGATALQAAAAFDYNIGADQVAGFVISRPTTLKAVAAEAADAVADITTGVYGTFTTREQGSGITSHDGYPRVAGTVLDLTRSSTTNVGWVRSLVMAALLQTTTTKLVGLPGPWGSGATTFVVRLATVLRTDGRAIIMGAVTSRTADDDTSRAASLIAAEIASGSGLARAGKTLADSCLGQTIAAPPKSLVDIIWVMDESGSMQSKRANLAAGASTFFQQAQQRGLDFRMGVTNVVSPSGSWASAVGKFCSVGSTNVQDDGGPHHFLTSSEQPAFAACINNPPGYESGAEYGLVNAEAAVKRHLPRAANAKGKIRTGAQVVIIVVTDEAPQSLKDSGVLPSSVLKTCPLPSSYQTQLDAALKGYLDTFTGTGDPEAAIDYFHVIGGTCISSGSSCNPEVAHGYKELAAKLNGQLFDVCSTNLGPSVTTIINGIVATGAPSLLVEVPISASVAVSLDGVTLQRSKVSGFYHPPLTKQISFSGAAQPKAGSKVVIAYKTWK